MESYRSIRLNHKKISTEVETVLDAYCLSAKNIYNSSLFIINNLFSSYNYNTETCEYEQKTNLHANQKDLITLTNKILNKLNLNHSKKLQLKKEKDPTAETKPRVFKQYTTTISKKTYYHILDKTVLENVLRSSEKEKEIANKDYTITHNHLAQPVLQNVIQTYCNYLNALKAYYKNNTAFTGKPNPPDYLGKNERCGFELFARNISDKGHIIRVLDTHQIYKKFPKKEPLETQEIEAFNNFNWTALINQDITTKNLKGVLSTIKITPVKYHKFKVQVEYTLKEEHIPTGFYAELLKLNDKFFKLKPSAQLDTIKSYFSTVETPEFMSLDLGQLAFATVAYNTTDRMINEVISADELNAKLTKIDNQIAKRKQSLIDATMTDEILQIHKNVSLKVLVGKEDYKKYQKFMKAVYIDDQLHILQQRKYNITQDYIHKLSKHLIENCLRKGLQVIVVGKNKFWKEIIKSTKESNRVFHNLPHARFIELLKYKALKENILVIETEESYTSLTSFVTDEFLQQYSATAQDINHPLLGIRHKSKFTVNGKTYNADVNGAFNIARKVFPKFRYEKSKITLTYIVKRLKLFGKQKLYTIYNRVLATSKSTPSNLTALAVPL